MADLKTNYCELAAECVRFGFVKSNTDAIICNFALHYMCDLPKNVQNILSFVNWQLKKDGIFIFTTLDGNSVFNLLGKNDSWEHKENDLLKYKIEKRYKSNSLTNTGQTIATLIPVSQTLMEEPLCNIDYVIKEAVKLGFKQIERDSFIKYKDLFDNNSLAAKLSKEDWDYIGLYHCVTLRKEKDLPRANSRHAN